MGGPSSLKSLRSFSFVAAVFVLRIAPNEDWHPLGESNPSSQDENLMS
jgi:hypothetical protein